MAAEKWGRRFRLPTRPALQSTLRQPCLAHVSGRKAPHLRGRKGQVRSPRTNPSREDQPPRLLRHRLPHSPWCLRAPHPAPLLTLRKTGCPAHPPLWRGRSFRLPDRAAAEKPGEAGNVIQAGENAQVAARANQGILLYDKLSTKAGSIAQALDSAAQSPADGEHGNDVKQRAYRQIRSLLREQANLLAGGSHADSGEP